MADIEPVSIQPPGRPFPQGRDLDAATAARMRRSGDPGDRMSFDTGTYTIEAQGHWSAAHWVGKVSMTGDGLSPASAWVNGALRALAPCWSTTDPTR